MWKISLFVQEKMLFLTCFKILFFKNAIKIKELSQIKMSLIEMNPISLITKKLFIIINALLVMLITINSQGSDYFEFLDVDLTKVKTKKKFFYFQNLIRSTHLTQRISFQLPKTSRRAPAI